METDIIISHFLKDELLRGGDESLPGPDSSLVSAGILDSVSLLKLLVFVEQRFSVRITDDELTPDNFDTVNRIAAFIGRKTSEAQEVEKELCSVQPEAQNSSVPGGTGQSERADTAEPDIL